MSFRTKTIASATITMTRNSVIFRENSASDFVQSDGPRPKATQRRRPAERAAVAIMLRAFKVQSPRVTGSRRLHDPRVRDSQFLTRNVTRPSASNETLAASDFLRIFAVLASVGRAWMPYASGSRRLFICRKVLSWQRGDRETRFIVNRRSVARHLIAPIWAPPHGLELLERICFRHDGDELALAVHVPQTILLRGLVGVLIAIGHNHSIAFRTMGPPKWLENGGPDRRRFVGPNY
jgi:hypothetical protein